MPLIRRDKLAPSRRPYAIDRAGAVRDSFRFGSRWNTEAYWVGRKNGRTTLTFGTLRLGRRVHRKGDELTLDQAIAEADMSYGGDWHYQWDGQVLLVNPAVLRMNPETQLKVSGSMDALLRDLPNVPDGYDGWYYRG